MVPFAVSGRVTQGTKHWKVKHLQLFVAELFLQLFEAVPIRQALGKKENGGGNTQNGDMWGNTLNGDILRRGKSFK